MTTGYEAGFYRQFEQLQRDINFGVGFLERIAVATEQIAAALNGQPVAMITVKDKPEVGNSPTWRLGQPEPAFPRTTKTYYVRDLMTGRNIASYEGLRSALDAAEQLQVAEDAGPTAHTYKDRFMVVDEEGNRVGPS